MTIEIGALIGAWEVLEDAGGGKYKCICTGCGKTVQKVRAHDLSSGKSLMCKKCSQVKENPKPIEYNSWSAMIQRCHNPNSKDYPNYGGRGIKVCDLWRNSFEAFFVMVGPRPEPHFTIERINTEGDYEPGNVKWASRDEQTKNQRNNVNLEIDGVVKTVAEWSEHPNCSVSKFTIYKRLNRGWDPTEAVFSKSKGKISNE